MKNITVNLYTFDELTDKAKDKARNWYRANDLDYEWYECVYEDAKAIGLKITEFDLDRNRHAKGILGVSVVECCSRILANHGKSCGTYELAERTFKARHIGKPIDVEEFTLALLEEYSIILQHESEYLSSNESVNENIIINEYTFTIDGKREG